VRKHIIADPEKCTGCGVCELVCAASKEKVFNPRLSRIKVVTIGEISVDTAIACRFCEKARCVKCCPRNALSQDEDTGILMVDETRCDGCGWCVEVCEFGALTLHIDKKVPIACDLCGGDPLCVKFCARNALELASLEEISEKVRKSVIMEMFSRRNLTFDRNASHLSK